MSKLLAFPPFQREGKEGVNLPILLQAQDERVSCLQPFVVSSDFIESLDKVGLVEPRYGVDY